MTELYPNRRGRWGNSKLLVVAEDDLDVRDVLVRVLDHFGYRVEAVSDGRALVDLLDSLARDGVRPALVLCDHRMPTMDGLDVLGVMRDRRLSVPFVLMSAFAGDGVLSERALRADVPLIRKPFDIADLITVVEYFVARSVRPRRCAACGSTEALRAADDGACASFCIECRRQRDDFDPDDPRIDLGVAD